MEYLDEQILKMKNIEKEKFARDIYGEYVWIDDEKITFRPTQIFEKDSISVMLPENYRDMPLDLAKIKYPMEERPQIIKSNNDYTTNFAFNQFNMPFTVNSVETATTQFRFILQKVNSSVSFFDMDFLEIEKNKLGFFDFKAMGIDVPLYQFFAFFPINNQLTQFIFNVPFEKMNQWKPIVLQIVRSIREY